MADLEAGTALARIQSSLLNIPDTVAAALFAALEQRVAEGRATLVEPPGSTGDPSWLIPDSWPPG